MCIRLIKDHNDINDCLINIIFRAKNINFVITFSILIYNVFRNHYSKHITAKTVPKLILQLFKRGQFFSTLFYFLILAYKYKSM